MNKDPKKHMLKGFFSVRRETSAYSFEAVKKEISQYCAENVEDSGIMMQAIDDLKVAL